MELSNICIRNRARIVEFLESEDTELQDEELFAHLEQCEGCCRRFENAAAGHEYWREAEELLQPGEFDDELSATFLPGEKTLRKIDRDVAVQRALDALAPTDNPNALGRIGLYEVTGVIGVGGMGVVLKAFDPSLDRVVAIKLLAPHFGNNKKARLRFSREARAAAAVLHPNVIPIHSVEESGELPFLVMSYIRGGSLQARLDPNQPFKLEEILRIGAQISAGLAAAHEQGLVHRDIKPGNILLEGDLERVTITDFGLARAVDDNTVTQLGTIAGTPLYMSPEQARGDAIDQTSDLFSLGSVMYAMCTGRPPFHADTSLGVMRQIIDETAVPIRQLNPEIPGWLAALIQKLLAKDVSERFESASEVKSLFERCLKHIQKPEEKCVPNELMNLSALEKEPTSVAKRSAMLRLLLPGIAAIALLAGLSWYSGILEPFDVTGGAHLSPRANKPAKFGEESKTPSQPSLVGSTESAESQKLSFDLEHLPAKIVALAGARLSGLEKTNLRLMAETFANRELLSRWVNRDNIEQILVFSVPGEESLITLVQTTNTSAEFLRDTFGVEESEADGKDLTISDGDVDYCVNTIDNRCFAMGSKSSLEIYAELRALTDQTSPLLEVAKNLRDGDVFAVIDSKTIDKGYGAKPEAENSSQQAASQLIRIIASSTTYLAVSAEYDEFIKARVSLIAVDAKRQKTLRETIALLKNLLILSIRANLEAGMLSDEEASIFLEGMESLEIDEGMSLETNLDFELDYEIVDLIYSDSANNKSQVQQK